VNLGDADLTPDLQLAEAFEEAEVKNAPLSLVEHSERAFEQHAILSVLVATLDRLNVGRAGAALVIPRRSRQRSGSERLHCRQGLDD
jgi:hypothetical protein